MKINLPPLITVVLMASMSLHTGADTGKSRLQVPPGFDLGSAMSTLYGNFDSRTQSSNYDIPQTTTLDLKGSSFEIGDEIIVEPFWVSEVTEGGIRKLVLLTFSVPKESFGKREDDLGSFSCHACAPLIGAAIFAERGGKWQRESSRTVVTQAGAWGDPPTNVKIIRIGPKRIGIELTIFDMHSGESSSFKIIMVPWKGKVNEAISYGASDEDKGSCGDEDDPPCFSNRTTLRFAPGTNKDYYDIQLTLSGTRLSGVEPFAPISAKGSEHLVFENGYYRIVTRTGKIVLSSE